MNAICLTQTITLHYSSRGAYPCRIISPASNHLSPSSRGAPHPHLQSTHASAQLSCAALHVPLPPDSLPENQIEEILCDIVRKLVAHRPLRTSFDPVLQQGDPNQDFFILGKGTVFILQDLKDGRKVVVDRKGEKGELVRPQGQIQNFNEKNHKYHVRLFGADGVLEELEVEMY